MGIVKEAATLIARSAEKESAALKREQIESSGLVSVGYDEASETLEVEFPSGTVYRYYEVPKELFEQLMTAPSKGQFFNSEIRNSHRYRPL